VASVNGCRLFGTGTSPEPGKPGGRDNFTTARFSAVGASQSADLPLNGE